LVVLEDALDALADRRQVRAATWLISAAGSEDGRTVALRNSSGEVVAGLALVSDDRLPAAQSERDMRSAR
jgi:hypothetical protein